MAHNHPRPGSDANIFARNHVASLGKHDITEEPRRQLFPNLVWTRESAIKQEPSGGSLLSRIEPVSDSLLSRIVPMDARESLPAQTQGALSSLEHSSGGMAGPTRDITSNTGISSANSELAELIIASALAEGRQASNLRVSTPTEGSKSPASETAVRELLGNTSESQETGEVPVETKVNAVENEVSHEEASQVKLVEHAKQLLVPIITQNARLRDPGADVEVIKARVMSLITDEQCLEFLKLAKDVREQMRERARSRSTDSAAVEEEARRVHHSRSQSGNGDIRGGIEIAHSPTAATETSSHDGPQASSGVESQSHIPTKNLHNTWTPPRESAITSTPSPIAKIPPTAPRAMREGLVRARSYHSSFGSTSSTHQESTRVVEVSSKRDDHLSTKNEASHVRLEKKKSPETTSADSTGMAATSGMLPLSENDGIPKVNITLQNSQEDSTSMSVDLPGPDIVEGTSLIDAQASGDEQPHIAPTDPSQIDTIHQQDQMANCPIQELLAQPEAVQSRPMNAEGATEGTAMHVDNTSETSSSHTEDSSSVEPQTKSKSKDPACPVVIHSRLSQSSERNNDLLDEDVISVISSAKEVPQSEVPQSTEVTRPTETSMEVDVPSLPSLLYVIAGDPAADVSEVVFEVDEALAAATRRWTSRRSGCDPSAVYASVFLLCLSAAQVRVVHEQLGADATPEKVAETLWAVPTKWPQQGKLIIEMNSGQPGQQMWLPRQLGPGDGPLEVTAAIQPGKNTARFIQLADSSAYLFVFFASTPPEKDLNWVSLMRSRNDSTQSSWTSSRTAGRLNSKAIEVC